MADTPTRTTKPTTAEEREALREKLTRGKKLRLPGLRGTLEGLADNYRDDGMDEAGDALDTAADVLGMALALLDDAADAERLRPLAAEVERLREERDTLGEAIGDAAHGAGIYNGEVPCTGPDLLMLADDMRFEIARLRAENERLMRVTVADLLDQKRFNEAEIARLRADLAAANERAERAERERDAIVGLPEWADRDDDWTPAIREAFPTRSGRHDLFAVAMQMVGNRNGKAALVSLVNWLLVEKARLHAASDTAASALAQEREARAGMEAAARKIGRVSWVHHEDCQRTGQCDGDCDPGDDAVLVCAEGHACDCYVRDVAALDAALAGTSALDAVREEARREGYAQGVEDAAEVARSGDVHPDSARVRSAARIRALAANQGRTGNGG